MRQLKNFYKLKQWEKKREQILRRDHFQCQEAKRYGKYMEAVIVHHIYPLEEYPELALKSWNLISLSKEYHNQMHDRKTNKITDVGAYWQRKRKKDFDKWKERPPSLCEKRNRYWRNGLEDPFQ